MGASTGLSDLSLAQFSPTSKDPRELSLLALLRVGSREEDGLTWKSILPSTKEFSSHSSFWLFRRSQTFSTCSSRLLASAWGNGLEGALPLAIRPFCFRSPFPPRTPADSFLNFATFPSAQTFNGNRNCRECLARHTHRQLATLWLIPLPDRIVR